VFEIHGFLRGRLKIMFFAGVFENHVEIAIEARFQNHCRIFLTKLE
jgi:hypothetical protein